MVTVIRENGDVHFLNEGEFITIKYCKEFKQVVGYPIQRTANIGLPMAEIEITDVQSVAYTNESQPTSLCFHCDKNDGEKRVAADYENDRLLDTVYPEMDRMETLEREEQRKKRPEWRSVQKNGNAVRFINVAKGNDIETVGQLLAVGRAGFERLRFMGRVCADEVSKALDNLYGIKQW